MNAKSARSHSEAAKSAASPPPPSIMRGCLGRDAIQISFHRRIHALTARLVAVRLPRVGCSCCSAIGYVENFRNCKDKREKIEAGSDSAECSRSEDARTGSARSQQARAFQGIRRR